MRGCRGHVASRSDSVWGYSRYEGCPGVTFFLNAAMLSAAWARDPPRRTLGSCCGDLCVYAGLIFIVTAGARTQWCIAPAPFSFWRIVMVVSREAARTRHRQGHPLRCVLPPRAVRHRLPANSRGVVLQLSGCSRAPLYVCADFGYIHWFLLEAESRRVRRHGRTGS